MNIKVFKTTNQETFCWFESFGIHLSRYIVSIVEGFVFFQFHLRCVIVLLTRIVIESPASLAPLTCPHQFSKLFASLVFLAKKDSHPQYPLPQVSWPCLKVSYLQKPMDFLLKKSPSLCCGKGWRSPILVQTNPSSKTISFLTQNQPQVFHFQLPHSFFSDSPALRSRGVSSWHHDFRTQQG